MYRVKGIVMIIIGSMLWGATGPMMEWLLENTPMTAEFMLAVRLMIAGVFVLLIVALQKIAYFQFGKQGIRHCSSLYLV